QRARQILRRGTHLCAGSDRPASCRFNMMRECRRTGGPTGIISMTKPYVLLAATLIPACGSNADQFVRPMPPVVALAHVHVIDGTGRPAHDDQTVIIERGRIVALGDTTAVRVP